MSDSSPAKVLLNKTCSITAWHSASGLSWPDADTVLQGESFCSAAPQERLTPPLCVGVSLVFHLEDGLSSCSAPLLL